MSKAHSPPLIVHALVRETVIRLAVVSLRVVAHVDNQVCYTYMPKDIMRPSFVTTWLHYVASCADHYWLAISYLPPESIPNVSAISQCCVGVLRVRLY